MEPDKNLKVYIVINTTLKMGKGKLLSQVGHGIEYMVENLILNKPDLFQEYKQRPPKKICVKADDSKIKELSRKHCDKCCKVIDAGLTQVEPGSLTVLVFYPTVELPDLKVLKLY